jgi:hypothetical protein
MQHVGQSADDVRVVEIWPAHASENYEYKQLLIEDDGVSTKHTEAKEYTELELTMHCAEKTITVDVNIVYQNFKPAYDNLWFTLCSSRDGRTLVWAQEGEAGQSLSKVDSKNRRMIGIVMPWK